MERKDAASDVARARMRAHRAFASGRVTRGQLSGFTLAELLMTITIASILLALAIPSFRGLMADSQLTAQVNDIVGAIRLARSEAIRRNTRVSFCRSGSETADDCAQNVGRWQHWIVRAASGSVIRRGM